MMETKLIENKNERGEKMSTRILKDFELETGIEVKYKRKDKLLTKDEFKKLIKTHQITVKTQKGLEYIEKI